MAAQAEVTEVSSAEMKDGDVGILCCPVEEVALGECAMVGIRRDVPDREMTGTRFRKDAADRGAVVWSVPASFAESGIGEFSVEKVMLW